MGRFDTLGSLVSAHRVGRPPPPWRVRERRPPMGGRRASPPGVWPFYWCFITKSALYNTAEDNIPLPMLPHSPWSTITNFYYRTDDDPLPMKIWSNVRWFWPGLGFSQPPNQIWERFSQKSIVSGLLRCHLKSPVECRCCGKLQYKITITKWNDTRRIIQRRTVPCQGHIA